MLNPNEKRIESCKKIGKIKKYTGHNIEKEFLKQYNENYENIKLNYNPCADTFISENNYIIPILKNKFNLDRFNVSNKSGKNIQFTLGQIPELKNIKNINILSPIYIKNILQIYLKKIKSDLPVDLFVYKYTEINSWIFFKMDDVIDFISNKSTWRILKSERIKGDITDNSKKGFSQYITYEYRKTHKSYFLGLNGNRGKAFIDLLMNKNYGIEYYIDVINV